MKKFGAIFVVNINVIFCKKCSIMKQYISILLMCMFFITASHASSDDRKVTASPNPVDRGAVLTVELPTEEEYGEITVILYNTVGRPIHTQKTLNKTVEFNVPNISGIYLLRIFKNQNVIAVEKIIVK